MHYLGQLPDLPLPHTGKRLRTRRKPVAQIVLCQGCCCGQTGRGLPLVPVDWLKPIWKAEKLNKIVQLTVSGCLGPCDLPNVCCIVTENEQAWYGRLTTREDYGVLLHWARRCQEENRIQPLPRELEHLRFERWPGDQEDLPFNSINQEPADIVLLTAADTEVLTWSAAAARLPSGFASIRVLNLDRLRHPRVFDAYLDDVLQACRVLVVRLLGGLGYWREPLEQIRLLAMTHDIRLICLPGDDQPDAQLTAYCTVPLSDADRVFCYCIAGGTVNAQAMFRFLSDSYLGTQFGFEPPVELSQVGIYHPDRGLMSNLKVWRDGLEDPNRPTAGIVFYRSHWVTGNLAPVDALIRSLEERGLMTLTVFGPTLPAILQSGLLGLSLDALITTTSFSVSAGGEEAKDPGQRPGLNSLDVPVLQAIFCSSSENVWAANSAGLSPRDIAMNVALPEFDGRIITTAISFKNTLTHDALLQTDLVRYQPRLDRIRHVADLTRSWANLRKTPPAQKKIAILLANYPSKNARIGNAVGLDTPASLHALLEALWKAGYDVGSSPPPDGQALMERLIAASIHDPEFASAPAFTDSLGWVTHGEYTTWLHDCPSHAREGIQSRWGRPEESPFFLADELSSDHSPLTTHHSPGFPIPGLLLGNIFIGIQPARGYDQEPSAVYHSPDLQPPHYYLAFYRWIRKVFGAHAVIHLGKHGNLEWLPGKGAALSEACYPEVILQDLPNIYPYIVNNPGEGTQAKRRSAAVIVDHLIPPMTQAGTYGELRQLENLLDEYYLVQSLDPEKAPLLLEEITKLVNDSQIYRDFDVERTPASAELPELLKRIDGYLCEIKEAQIRDGLHILGRLPEGEQLVDLLFSLVRVDNGSVPGIVKALASDLGLDYNALSKDLSAAAPSQICNWQLATGNLQSSCESLRTCGDVSECLGLIARHLIRECQATSSVRESIRGVLHNCKLQNANGEMQIEITLDFLLNTIWPKLQLCHQEIDHILAALEGRFVPPGPSGAPTRGRVDVLPTGRNFYSLDIRAIPTPTAWQVGWSAANALLERHRQRTGSYPESIALVVWGTSNMRTGGDDIAEILALLGVRPRWDDDSRRIVGIEPISLVELARPRIDVTVRISGLFRDAFPNLIRLLNEAVALVANLQEPLDRNFVKAHIARDTALLSRGSRSEASGVSYDPGTRALTRPARQEARSSILDSPSSISPEEAARLAGLRVFGSKPGAYGAGLLPLIDNRNWHSSEDLAEVYLAWSSYAYTGKDETSEVSETSEVFPSDGREEREAFRIRLAHTEVVAQNQDNREHDIFDSDDYFQFHGGLIAAVRAIASQAPAAYLSDTSRTEDVRARTLHEEACRVFRSRVINPRWLEGVMRHGYKGAVEMAATVDYLFGYDATAEVLEDWMYERLADAYLLDGRTRDFLRQNNPWAERAMIERLLEAAERGLWEHPDAETLQRLRDQHGSNDAWLEGRTTAEAAR